MEETFTHTHPDKKGVKPNDNLITERSSQTILSQATQNKLNPFCNLTVWRERNINGSKTKGCNRTRVRLIRCATVQRLRQTPNATEDAFPPLKRSQIESKIKSPDHPSQCRQNNTLKSTIVAPLCAIEQMHTDTHTGTQKPQTISIIVAAFVVQNGSQHTQKETNEKQHPPIRRAGGTHQGDGMQWCSCNAAAPA